MNKHPRLKWKTVAALLQESFGIGCRTAKQCRERWMNHLSPDLEKRQWTDEENHILFFYQHIFGNKWSKIAKELPNRPENSIKNHFYCTLRRKIKEFNRRNPDQLLTEDLNSVLKDQNLVEFLVNYEGKEIPPGEVRNILMKASKLKSVSVQTEESCLQDSADKKSMDFQPEDQSMLNHYQYYQWWDTLQMYHPTF